MNKFRWEADGDIAATTDAAAEVGEQLFAWLEARVIADWRIRPSDRGGLVISHGDYREWRVWADGGLTYFQWRTGGPVEAKHHPVGSELHSMLSLRASVVREKEASPPAPKGRQSNEDMLCWLILKERPSCHTCHWYKGSCHRHAPTAAGWPRVEQTDVCGDYRFSDRLIKQRREAAEPPEGEG